MATELPTTNGHTAQDGENNFAVKAGLARMLSFFERVTMTPHCRKLVDVNLLTEDEKKFINEYHQEVFEKTSKFFENDPLTMAWLKRETAHY